METDARSQGWRPLAEFRGKAGTWKSAKQFIEDGKNFLPFVQAELARTKDSNARMVTEMEGLRGEVTTTRQQMERLLDYSRKADQAGYDRAVADLKKKQRQAVADGDTAAFDEIEGQLGEMAEARAEEVPPAPVPAAERKPAVDTAYADFVAANPWFNQDRTLNATMIAEHNAVIEEFPAMPLAEQLEKAKEQVMTRHPKKFGVDAPPPKPRQPAAPIPPRNRPPAPNTKSGFDSIEDPTERAQAKAGYAQAKKSMPNLKEDEYIRIFKDPHADVLDVIQNNK